MDDCDVMLCEFAMDQLTYLDLKLLQAFCEANEHKPHSGPLLSTLEQLAHTEHVRREGSPDTPPQRYFRLTCCHWTGAELAFALRTLDCLAKSEDFSETLGRIIDQLLEQVIAWVNQRLTRPELFR